MSDIEDLFKDQGIVGETGPVGPTGPAGEPTRQTTITPTGTTAGIDWDDGDSVIIDLESATGTVTLTLSNPVDGGSYLIKFLQDSGSNFRDVTLPSSVLLPGESAPTTLNITEVADAIDVLALYYDGATSKYLAQFSQNYG